MTLFATFRLESPALEDVFESTSEITLRVDQRSMTKAGRLDLTTWVSGGDVDTFEDELDADGTVIQWHPIGWANAHKFHRIRLNQQVSSRMEYDRWTDGRLARLSSKLTEAGWLVDAFVGDRTVLQTLARECKSNDGRFELLRASETNQSPTDQLPTDQFALTELQAETLRMAFDQGLYSVPRGISLEEFATQFDVSHQALSERLRRGVNSLIEATIVRQRDSTLQGPPTSTPRQVS